MDIQVQGDSCGAKRHATLRPCAASLTATTGGAVSEHPGTVAGEGTR
ncbi:DUF6380 family protein [Streptomyces sp. NPDC005551]